MKKRTILLIVPVLIIIGAFVLALRSEAPATKPGDIGYTEVQSGDALLSEEQIGLPWVEVLSAGVFVKTALSWEPVNTGDEVGNGIALKTDESGLAEIHFPDGSALRLDSNSEIIITQGDYNETNDSLQVRIALTLGRVWSKIIELSTPESFWEVESANAIAAVRGTSFGMEYSNDETQIIGSENSVEVSAVDPATKKRLGNVSVVANKMIKIHRELIDSARNKQIVLNNAVQDIPDEIKTKLWVSRAALADQVILRRIEALKARGYDPAEIKRMMREELLVRRREILLRLKNQGLLPRLLAPPTGTVAVPAEIKNIELRPVLTDPVQTSTDSIELLNVR